MKANLVRNKQGRLCSAMDEDLDKLRKLPIGVVYEFSTRIFRNYDFHKKFFAMLKLTFENQDQYEDKDHFRKIMTMKAGFFDEVATGKGLVFLPKSISFDNMDQDEFEVVYDKVLTQCMNHVAGDKDEVLKELAGFG